MRTIPWTLASLTPLVLFEVTTGFGDALYPAFVSVLFANWIGYFEKATE